MSSMSSRTPDRWFDAGFRGVASLWIHRRTLRLLARHDLRKVYAGTAGGVAWSLVTPLVTILIFSAIFSFGMRLPLGKAPYIYGFAAAYVPWLLLSASLTGATGSLIEHRYLIKRVVFPVEIIPAGPLLVHSLPHAVLLTLTAAACLTGGYGHFPEILLIIYFYLCAAVLTISAGLFLAGLAVIVRDVQQVLPSLLNVWFWMTPIAWARNTLPPAGRMVLALNPASYVVSGYRYALMPKVFPAPGRFEATAFWSISIVMLLTASACFRRLRAHFWDCL
jgi:teichoic acid transport system permease protein